MDIILFKRRSLELMRSLRRKTNAALRALYEPYGLTAMQAMLLLHLAQSGPQNIGDLGKTMDMASGNMSSLCKRLERDGYLRRERDSSDERIVRAIATQKTLDIFGSIDQTLHARFAALAETLSEEDLQCIIDGITKLDMLLDRLPLTDGKE